MENLVTYVVSAPYKLTKLPKVVTGAAVAAEDAVPSITGAITAAVAITEEGATSGVEAIEADLVKEEVVILQQPTLGNLIITITKVNMGNMGKAQDKGLELTKYTSMPHNTPKDTDIKEKTGQTCGRL